ncbi:MAG: EAL domain-containing protein [Chromatocurvus sp.]
MDVDQRAAFDLLIRNKAVQMAADLELGTALNLNFLPSAALNPETSLCLTIEAAEHGFPAEQIIFEATETEFIDDLPGFAETIKQGQRYGFQLAVDDFGAGNAGLGMLADFQPDYVKMDVALVRDIESKGPRQAIARAVSLLCEELGMSLVAEGVETIAEYRWLRQLGICLFQGFLFAKHMFEGRPLVRYPKD